jgi:hypothetical protein
MFRFIRRGYQLKLTARLVFAGCTAAAGLGQPTSFPGTGIHFKVDCSHKAEGTFPSIHGALKLLVPSASNVVTVSGTCKENLLVQGFDRLTLIFNHRSDEIFPLFSLFSKNTIVALRDRGLAFSPSLEFFRGSIAQRRVHTVANRNTLQLTLRCSSVAGLARRICWRKFLT